MNRDERNALIATVGLALTALGAFLPWARIGGRNRSGFNTADTFISLADGALPDQIAWIGRWWYLPALLAFIVWATTFFAGGRVLRFAGIALVLTALAMWWLFVWAGQNYNVLDTQLVGPAAATIGITLIGYASSRPRGSIIRPSKSGPNDEPGHTP